MRTCALKLAALALLLLVSACANAQLSINNLDLGKVFRAAHSAKDATTDISEPQEIILGQDIASNLLGLAPLLADQQAQAYVNQIGRWLSLQTERADLPWAFAVLNDEEINAFAAPGGYIIITKGLLNLMHNEAELAGVLAHEIAHVLRKHHLHALKKAAGMSFGKDVLSIGLDAKGGNPALIKLTAAGTELYTRGLDKDDEYEADRMGVVIATRAGYDPYGLAAVLQRLQAINAQSAALSLLFKSHPALADRLNLLEIIMSSAFDQFEQQPNLAARFKSMLGHGSADKR